MIGTIDDPVELISARLRARGIVIPRDNEWLNGCVECFTSSNPNVTQNQLFDLVFEQWTLADLNDVRAPTLPSSCVNCTKMMLTGKYAVQINYFLNVAVPLHKQLQEIRRPNAQKNLEVDNERQEKDRDRVKGNVSRTLKMEITDGVTTVIGFEDQPIAAIKNPIPGEKAVLSGPIEVRKGVLMLKPANVTMVGGEVDTLLVKNATENLLARALNQPENPDPYSVNPALRESTPLHQPPVPPIVSAATSQPLPRTTPAPLPNSIQDAFEDGDDEAMASLAEALENDSFQLESPVHLPNNNPLVNNPARNASKNDPSQGDDEAMDSLAEALLNDPFQMVESPVHRPKSNPELNARLNNPANPQQAIPTRNTSKNDPVRPPKPTSSQKPTKQQPITAFLSQPRRASQSQVFDISSDIDDGFGDDFELIAAQTASLAEQRASRNSNDKDDPEKLKRQLAASYAGGSEATAATSRVKTGTGGCPNPIASTAHRPGPGGEPEDSRQPNKRKDSALGCDIFGRPKIPRNESNSSSPSEALPFKNPRHALNDELTDAEELHDWLPPPPRVNLEHLRPSHEKGKILVDYTDSSTLDLDLVSTQKKQQNRLKPDQKPAVTSSLEEPTMLDLDLPSNHRRHREDVKTKQNPVITSLEEPFPPKEFPSTRTTSGKVIKVVNKLQLRDAKWVLSAIVEAKGIEMEMDFSPEALDKVFTVTAEEIMRQKEQLKKNPELKEKFNAHLRESQKRIQTLNCQMTIHFKNFISKPVVLDVSKNNIL